MYDDDEEEDDEEESLQDAETLRREGAEVTRGKDDRVFYDGLAKEEDARHNAMRVEMQKRALVLGELRQKLRHKEAEFRALETKIQIEEDRVAYEAKKNYRLGMGGIGVFPPENVFQPIPILIKDIDQKDVGAEFSIERAKANIKQLEEQKIELKIVINEMSSSVSEEARALSQLQHNLLRM